MSILNILRQDPNISNYYQSKELAEVLPEPFDSVFQGINQVNKPIGKTFFTPMDLFSVPQAFAGNPLAMANLGLTALASFAPRETFEQRMMRGFYDDKFGLDNIGRIQSGIMQGYSPVYGISGGAGLTKAIDRRINTIQKTLARKYGDPNYKGPKTELDERLEKLLDLKQQEEDAREQTTQAMGIGFGGSTSGARAGGGGFGGDTAGGFSESDPTATEGSFRYGGIASL